MWQIWTNEVDGTSWHFPTWDALIKFLDTMREQMKDTDITIHFEG